MSRRRIPIHLPLPARETSALYERLRAGEDIQSDPLKTSAPLAVSSLS